MPAPNRAGYRPALWQPAITGATTAPAAAVFAAFDFRRFPGISGALDVFRPARSPALTTFVPAASAAAARSAPISRRLRNVRLGRCLHPSAGTTAISTSAALSSLVTRTAAGWDATDIPSIPRASPTNSSRSGRAASPSSCRHRRPPPAPALTSLPQPKKSPSPSPSPVYPEPGRGAAVPTAKVLQRTAPAAIEVIS